MDLKKKKRGNKKMNNKKNMRSKKSKRVKGISLAIMLVLGITITMPLQADAVDIGTTDSIKKDVGREVYRVPVGDDVMFSDYPRQWRVVAKDEDTMTLFMDSARDLAGPGFDPETHKNWSGSMLCNWLNQNYTLIDFSTAELDAMAVYGQVGVVDSADGIVIDENQRIVVPSYEEVRDGGIWGMNDKDRKYTSLWRLRSPLKLNGNTFTQAVLSEGSGYQRVHVMNDASIRPTFKIKLSSIVLTSNAKGGKLAAGSSELSAAQAPSGTLKLTLLDDANLSLAVDTDAITAPNGETVSIPYTGAKTGEGHSVSVMVCDKDSGEVLLYGRPVDCATAGESGTASFTIPDASALPKGSYTLRIFNEQVNGDNVTDYASTPLDIPLTIDDKPTVEASLTINPMSDDSIKIGELYNKAVQATYTGSDELTFSAEGLPEGMSIDPSTGLISGISTTEGDYLITVTANDGTISDTSEFTIHVTVTPETPDPGTSNPDTGNTDTPNPDTGNPDTGNTDTGNPDTENPDTGNTDTNNTGTDKTPTAPDTTKKKDEAQPNKVTRPKVTVVDTTKAANAANAAETKTTMVKTPRTGDKSSIGLWGVVAAVSLVMICAGAMIWRRELRRR